MSKRTHIHPDRPIVDKEQLGILKQDISLYPSPIDLIARENSNLKKKSSQILGFRTVDYRDYIWPFLNQRCCCYFEKLQMQMLISVKI